MMKSLLTCFLLLSIYLLNAQESNKNDLFLQVGSLLHNNYNSDQPGVAVSIIKNGNVVYKNQKGTANLEYNIPISDSTAFNIASVSKQFTAFLAVLLEKENKLSMSDDIRNHLPELKHLPYKITLRHLASHTHGLPNSNELANLAGKGLDYNITHQEIAQMLLNIKQVNFKPGAKYEYNNTGFILLAEIIERVTGKPFQEVLQDRIFKPLQMDHSMAVSSSSIIVKNKAYSYKKENDMYKNYVLNMKANGSSGISTTIDDLSKWAIEFQNPNKINNVVFDEMTQTTTLNSGKTIDYGLGLEFKNYRGVDVVFHGGGTAGFRSYLLHIPEYMFSVVILGNNNDFTPLNIVYNIVDLFLEEHLEEPSAPKKVRYSNKELKAFEGTYEMFPGTYYNILAENDTLYFQSFGRKGKAPLPVIGDGEFLFPYVPTTKFSFYENGFIFNIADFKYDCKKVELKPKDIPSKSDLLKFEGAYKNEEFNINYELVMKNNQLVASHSINGDFELFPLAQDSFYTNQSVFSKVDFIKNDQGDIIEFQLSGRNIKNLKFRKIN
ncbi:serine hydrolase [Mangrovivirga sp. M17]|uniref:Serine hydrolase n=1 Tax=Mangrovivirga halotolerans TaxID=2993936 RepID=A0ABT3RV33_9BACT|nr:serine hydrolase domain-containing protein [Mangrovivirga halotolerans]MCX2745488.1 serine hydrolase [Mangrovivirga halotolerans]